MGVHQNRETYIKVKEILGIPADEPIFVFRAQDKFAIENLLYYKDRVHDNTIIGTEDEAWVEQLKSVIDDFLNWRRDNLEKIKAPD